MTDRERLEKLKQQKVWKDATGFVFLTVPVEDYKFLFEKAQHVFMYEDAAEEANAVIEQTNEKNIALRERVQELEEEKERYQSGRNVAVATKMKMDDLEKQNKRYREALEFYADREKYSVRMDDLELPEDILHAEPRITSDMGREARKALEESE